MKLRQILAAAPRLVLRPRTLCAPWMLLALLWLLDITGIWSASMSARGMGLIALAATVVAALVAARRLLGRRPEGPVLLGLVALALVLAFVGLDHEVGRGYYTDEGHYLHHAREINDGNVFTRSFVYPHLLYYLDAFALWLAGLFPTMVDALARGLWNVRAPAAQEWLVLRWISAALGASTVVPVFLVARRILGSRPGALFGGAMAGGLVACAAPYHAGFQVNICDVPSAVLAAWCLLWTSRLLDGEKASDYVVAGALSGLAAATKYPAGVVATAIAALWLRRRLATRSWNWGLVAAGAASLGAFLAVNFSIFRHPDGFLGPRGVLFGVNQYTQGGWTGVMPTSKSLYYLDVATACFGVAALVVAVLGVVGLEREARRRLAWMSIFPAVYFVLIASMRMVVARNLFPIVPVLAILLGVGAAGLLALLRRAPGVGRTRGARATLFPCAVAVVVLAVPAWTVGVQVAAMTQPSTRDVMSAWVRRNLPPGAGILKESYTPNFPAADYRTIEHRFAFRIPERRWKDPSFEYLLLAGHAYGRFYNADNRMLARTVWYDAIFEGYELLVRVEPERLRLGPELRLYRLPAERADVPPPPEED